MYEPWNPSPVNSKGGVNLHYYTSQQDSSAPAQPARPLTPTGNAVALGLMVAVCVAMLWVLWRGR